MCTSGAAERLRQWGGGGLNNGDSSSLALLSPLHTLIAIAIKSILRERSLYWWSILRLLNLSCFIVDRSHVFSLLAIENERSLEALVAGFTRSKQTTLMTSPIAYRSACDNSLTASWMSRKHTRSLPFIICRNSSNWQGRRSISISSL